MLRVNRFAAAIDMIAAGTSAPMPIAANATPANQRGNICWNSSGTTVLPSAAGLRAERQRLHARRDRHVAEQRDQPQQQAVGRQRGHVPLDHVAVRGREHAGDRVRVEEQRQRRAERQGRVLQLPLPGSRRPSAGAGRPANFASRGVEDGAPAAQLRRDVDDRDHDHHVDQRVLDEGDQRRRPQPGLVGVGGQDRRRRGSAAGAGEHAAGEPIDLSTASMPTSCRAM